MKVNQIRNTTELARRSGWDRPNLSRLMKGKGGYSKESIQRLADALGVSVSVLLDDGSNVSPVPLGDRAVPVVEQSDAGKWNGPEGISYISGEIMFTTQKASPRVFAMRIKGDSMRPLFVPGDLVIVDPDVAPLPGDFVVASDPGEGTVFKQYREREIGPHGKPIFDLHPLNEMFPVLRGDRSEVRIVGTMIEHRRYRYYF